ncbi:GtrA family protein [Streptomyces sp. B1866]|uniref:GtrA family protein n=1 Tax=Streptomyces sp. B1866 TaxID=3075431 RepID=UPI00288D17AA|nr:GtrA family protein [Streptomyces sp. B1866]MDT3398363.1 GtrA family protein [Streptomyces sp. B1866]
MMSELRALSRRIGGEVGRFGTVGAVGWLVDTAVFNICLHVLHLPTVRSGLISSAVAIATTYLGNRYWTYRHRPKDRRTREISLFVLFSGVGSVIQNGALALSHYGFDFTSALADNLAKNVVGLGLGTLFRFWCYRTWVFRARPGGQEPGREAVDAAERILQDAGQDPAAADTGEPLGR